MADREGKFSSAVEAPTLFGSHSLTLIDSVSGKALDVAMVSVRPIERPHSLVRRNYVSDRKSDGKSQTLPRMENFTRAPAAMPT